MQQHDIDVRDRIIVALDLAQPEQARDMVKRCESHVGFFKVGLELFMADWFNIVDWLHDRGHRVMLDLKFFDIPETVKRTVAQLNNRGISLATIHGQRSIIEAAVAARGDFQLLAVTVLTSFGEAESRGMGVKSVEELVLQRAREARELGCDGIVASGQEAERVRAELGSELLIVTPGIRLPGSSQAGGDDQRRVVTAGDAVARGASHVVVGRPITRADDPLAVIKTMQADIINHLRNEQA